MTVITNDLFLRQVEGDFFHMFCENFIGSGYQREVWSYRLDPTMVVKIEDRDSFQNVTEYTTWEYAKHLPEVAKWLAPVHSISPCGRVLLQSRTTLLKDGYILPKTLPNIFTDLKIDNWGMYKNRFVCHDYGITRVMKLGVSEKHRKANWGRVHSSDFRFRT